MLNSGDELQQVPGHRRRSSSLLALGTLTPPSPELKPTSLHMPSYTGEITVTLYNEFDPFRPDSPIPASQSIDTINTFGIKKRTDTIWETQSFRESMTISEPPSASLISHFPSHTPLAASASDSYMISSRMDISEAQYKPGMQLSTSISVYSQPMRTGCPAPQILIDSAPPPPRQFLDENNHQKRGFHSGPSMPSFSSLGSICAASTANLVSSISMESGFILPQPNHCGLPHIKDNGAPMNFSWLKRLSVQLWIDQECFRAVRVDFKLFRLVSAASLSPKWYNTGANEQHDIEANTGYADRKSVV